jgi:hypothetical protein
MDHFDHFDLNTFICQNCFKKGPKIVFSNSDHSELIWGQILNGMALSQTCYKKFENHYEEVEKMEDTSNFPGLYIHVVRGHQKLLAVIFSCQSHSEMLLSYILAYLCSLCSCGTVATAKLL